MRVGRSTWAECKQINLPSIRVARMYQGGLLHTIDTVEPEKVTKSSRHEISDATIVGMDGMNMIKIQNFLTLLI